MSRRFSLTTALIAVCGLLAAAIALLWLVPDSRGLRRHQWRAPAAQPPALDSLGVNLPAPAPVALASFPTTLQRPLFVESRRPAPVAPAVAPPAPPPEPDRLDQAQLMGVISGAAFVGVLVRVDDKVRTIRRGDQIGAWKLDSILDRDVVFTQGDQRRVLTLKEGAGAATAAAGAAPSPAAPSAAPPRPSARTPAPASMTQQPPVPAPPPPAPAPAQPALGTAAPTPPPAPAAAPAQTGEAWTTGGRSAAAPRRAASGTSR